MSTFLKAKRLEVFIIVVVIALIGVVYAFTQKASAPVISSSQNQTQQNVGEIRYQGQDGRNALELLQVFHKVEVKHFSFGDQVISIDGVAPDGTTEFWEFFVNGQSSPVGASTYITKSEDTLSWKVSKIEAF